MKLRAEHQKAIKTFDSKASFQSQLVRKMNKFNKVKFLQTNGLLNARFDYETLKFERSWRFRLQSYLVTFFKATMPLKLVASWFFKREDEIQLWIGNRIWEDHGRSHHLRIPNSSFSLRPPGSPYNFFAPEPKFWIALAVSRPVFEAKIFKSFPIYNFNSRLKRCNSTWKGVSYFDCLPSFTLPV